MSTRTNRTTTTTHAVCLRPALKPSTGPSPSTLLPLTQTASLSQKEKKRLAKQDPYRWAQMQQRKNTHLERRTQLQAERATARGDPVRGMTTPFVESLDSAGQAPLSTPPVDEDGNPLSEPHPLPTSPHVLNNLIQWDELEAALANAYELTRPDIVDLEDLDRKAEGEGERGAGVGGEEGEGEEGGPSIAAEVEARADPEKARRLREEQDTAHERAAEAIRRIVHLDAGSAKDRRHANVRRIIETFGRHNTDTTLKPRALSRGQLQRQEQQLEQQEQEQQLQNQEGEGGQRQRPVRAGPDTGSSEVQIGILTAKIRALANELEKGRGYRDKVGKRDLRLLVHRRQRLLQYMERKERGSERWTHMVQTLGLTEATYKGQITL